MLPGETATLIRPETATSRPMTRSVGLCLAAGRRGVLAGLFAGFLLGHLSASSAVTPVKKTFAELVAQADFILVGVISNSQSLQLPEGAIVTDLTLDIRRSVKGDRPAGSSLMLRMLGGKLGDVELVVDGAPALRPGQTVLLFVRGNMSEMFPFVGVQQGVFHVRQDQSAGVERVFDWLGKPVLGIRDGEVSVDQSGTESDAISLDQFIREIEQQLRS